MRKNVVALMLVLPLLFVFVVFSAVSTASLGVLIAVTGIEIKGKPAGNTLYINLANYSEENAYELDVGVKPSNASNREFDYLIEEDGAELAEIEMVGNKIVPHSVGSARITAQSRDGGFRDSISVVVTSSAPYDFAFSLYHAALDAEKENDLLAFDRETGTYGAADKALVSGTYLYQTAVFPTGLASPVIKPAEGYEDAVIVDAAKGTILFPFAGRAVFDVTLPACVREDNRTKRVDLEIAASDDVPMLVNGDRQEKISVGVINEDSSDWRPRTEIYVQTGEGLSLSGDIAVSPAGTATPTLSKIAGGEGRYRVGIVFEDTAKSVTLTLTAEGGNGKKETKEIVFDFEIFSFHLNTEGLQDDIEDGGSQMLLRDQSIIFSVVPEFEVSNMLYTWDVIDHSGAELSPDRYEDMILIDPTNGGANPDGARCKITAVGYNSIIVRVRAAFADGDGNIVPYTTVEPVRVTVSVTEEVTTIQINDISYTDGGKEEKVDKDHAFNSLGGTLTLAHSHYAGKTLEVEESQYFFEIDARQNRINETTGQPEKVLRSSSLTARAVDPDDPESPSSLIPEENLVFVNTYSPTGEVTGIRLRLTLPRESNDMGSVLLVVEWAANESFDREVSRSIKLIIVNNAVQVRTSEQIFDATRNRNSPIVLAADIMLGTDANGARLSLSERTALLREMTSTYNTQFYTNIGTPEAAKVYYVLEFRFSLYGNGYSINAEHFTNALDDTGHTQLFRGPLDFVNLASIASVAGQDNIAFLCRTDGVTLYNAVLLGCDDASLTEGGMNDLRKLDFVGTTLEINADVTVLNCRIRNGRNVVRAYGGNRDGAGYFVNDRRTITGIDEADRIRVTIEGCIISQGREFLLKLGANRALQALKDSGLGIDNGVEPGFLNALGAAYDHPSSAHPEANETLLSDTAFYDLYVMTDLTLKDSVLETSGLFTIGVESNFSGSALYSSGEPEDGLLATWAGTGGTSFAAVLRLAGDVRLYDWKDLSLIDSSTLIQINGEFNDEDLSRFSLNVAKMLSIVKDDASGDYSDIYKTETDENGGTVNYVHGGIAFYGGGRNYSMLDVSALDESLSDLHRYYINISVLLNDSETSGLAQILPRAAGTQDFRFYMYDAASANSIEKQQDAIAKGTKYSGVKGVSPF